MRTAIVLSILFLLPAAATLAPADGGGIARVDHSVPVGDDVMLHVVEAVPNAARVPPRAIIFVPATLVDHHQWNADVTPDGSYNAIVRAAQQGFHAFAFDWEGYGQSTHPANGLTVTAERMLPQAGALLEWVRVRTGAERVDLVGASLGDSIAFALGGSTSPIDANHVGRVALTSHVYADPSPAILVLTGPPACIAMENAPNGYMDTNAAMYAPILWTATPEAQLWAYQNFPGTYAAGPTHEGCDLPAFPASWGRAPARVFYGTLDLITNEADVQNFCADYGGPCELDLI
jgi:pimeloyl-ACP methyl ester carboxylesterase